MFNFMECMKAQAEYRNSGDVYIRAEGGEKQGGIHQFMCGDVIACLLVMSKMMVQAAYKADIPMNVVYEMIAEECRGKMEGLENAEECE